MTDATTVNYYKMIKTLWAQTACTCFSYKHAEHKETECQKNVFGNIWCKYVLSFNIILIMTPFWSQKLLNHQVENQKVRICKGSCNVSKSSSHGFHQALTKNRYQKHKLEYNIKSIQSENDLNRARKKEWAQMCKLNYICCVGVIQLDRTCTALQGKLWLPLRVQMPHRKH